jgi:NAD(P)-dependent dehydrogenase (short-subunit alcohol dehydrogenase family)
MNSILDSVAIVTGASTGIGRATAIDFAEKGANVVVADVNVLEGNATVSYIRGMGRKAIFVRCDVANEIAVEAMVAATISEYGRLDFACNNAGIEGTSSPLAEMKNGDWQRVIDVNLTGVFFCMKHEILEMQKVGGGAIVNMASILGQVGFASAGAYTAAKHGVLGLTKVAALEYASKGIRVNAVCPAFIDTPMLTRGGLTTDPEIRKTIEALHPIGRLGEPEEVAKVVTWLCSTDASFMVGEAVLVDGGYLAR